MRFLLRRLLRALGRATGTSHQIALGMAIGFFVAWLPIIGLQMLVSIVICQIAHANKIVPIFPVWLTNPVTMVPIYSFNYWVGWLIVGGPPLSDIARVLGRMLTVPGPGPDAGRFEAWWESIRHAFSELFGMGWDMQLPLWLGCAVVGLALAIPSYALTRKFVDSFREAVAKKRQLRRDLRRRQHLAADIVYGNKGLGRKEGQ
ncbi:MAG: DUF2062 domain-containing protein [Planctomycetota bacterium]|nr:DUF2062 domain-containing protein [Planctomycetota bacterium]